MEKFTVGDVVLISFPFSDLSGKKLRPALVLAKSDFNNLVICQITSQAYNSRNYVKLTASDFKQGSLPVTSFIRFDKIFTAEPSIITGLQAKLNQPKMDEVKNKLLNLFELEN